MPTKLKRYQRRKRLDGFANRARLECISKDAIFPTEKPIYECINPHASGWNLLDVVYDFPSNLDPKKLKEVFRERRMSTHPIDASGVWRFRELLPFVDNPDDVVTLGEGNTRLLEGYESARYVGLPRLWFKHQGDNPTGSFKDPGMSGAITEAKKLKMKAVACASTGNTSASMAAYARRADMLPIVFLPKGQVTYGKLSQSLDFGALTLEVDTDFDGVMKLIMEVAPQVGAYVANSINPFRIEGQKTIVAELLEQMDWQMPDRIVVPGGNLGHASSIWKGLRELKALGFIDRYPRLTVVQAAGADPLYKGVTSNSPERITPVHAKTLATAIKIGNPISYQKALEGVRETNGWVTEVTEQEIADAKAIIGRDGIGCEPASAVTIAGLKKIVTEGTDVPFDRGERVVAILTGNMLKDPSYPVLYHSDDLYEESIVETLVTRAGHRIIPKFANQPKPVKDNAGAIIDIIRSELAA